MIREYRATDLDRIFHLDEVCFAAEFRFDRASMRAFAEAKNAIALIDESEAGELAGFLIVHLEGVLGRRLGYVMTLDVAPEHRREGVAGRLMEEAEQQAAVAGAGWMELHVFSGNEGAVRFYESRGYERVGVRRGFYGVGMDAFVYQKLLG